MIEGPDSRPGFHLSSNTHLPNIQRPSGQKA